MVSKVDFDAAWSLMEIIDRVERAAPLGRKRHDMEFTEDATADWFLVQAYPGQDARAFKWLVRRKFGVFQPRKHYFEDREISFGGWLFVYCWDIEAMAPRILRCPGVMDILRDPVTEEPKAIDGAFVSRLRAEAATWSSASSHDKVTAARHIKRSSKRLTSAQRRDLHRLKDAVRELHLWDDQQWRHANQLEAGERIRLFKATLDEHCRRSVAHVA